MNWLTKQVNSPGFARKAWTGAVLLGALLLAAFALRTFAP